MITLNEQIKRELAKEPEEKWDEERQRKERLDSDAAWVRVAVKRGRGLSPREEMGMNI